MDVLRDLVPLLVAIITAVIAATGAVRLDRHFQEIDRRRDLYLEVLGFIDNIAVMVQEQLVAGTADSNTTMIELERQIETQKTKLDLLASEKVRKAMKAYRDATPKVMQTIKAPGSPAGQQRDLRDAIRHGLATIRPERDALAECMRKDLKQKVFARRKI
jgi:hypothetical protein